MPERKLIIEVGIDDDAGGSIEDLERVTSNSNNTWNSTEPVTYQYNGSTYTNYAGNYWSDYTGNDTDGDAAHPIPPSG